VAYAVADQFSITVSSRKRIQTGVETSVLLLSGRKCCLCVYLFKRDGVAKGQIAHLNHDPSDPRFENLVYLCLEHHDEYDGRTSQSKGYTAAEVREYRDKLYIQNDPHGKWKVQRDQRLAEPTESSSIELPSEYEAVRKKFPAKIEFANAPWRFPLWQVANEPEYFAYKAGNRADGVCLVERINLPDGRIVIACIETAGNPGQSITNCVEELCFQVCERFGIPANRLVWLEHYDYDQWDDWSMVTFGQTPPQGPFTDPKWEDMTPARWQDLRLRPKKKLTSSRRSFDSKLAKLFPWSTLD